MGQTRLTEVAAAYQQQCTADISDAKAALARLEGLSGPSRVDTVLEPLNDLWMIVDRALNKAGLYRSVHPDPSLREVAERCEQELSQVATDIGLSRPIYEAVAAVDASAEDEVTQRYLAHVLRDFRRAGVDKSSKERDEIRRLKDELVVIGQEFSKNIREDVRSILLDSADELAGLPDDYVESHSPDESGHIRITTDYTDYIPFMTYAHDDERRLELYKAFRQRGYPANKEVLDEMLRKRHELAGLLGYPSWADYITEDKMIRSKQAVREFVEKVATMAFSRSERDYQELLAQLRRLNPEASAVGDWQRSYLEEQLKREKYELESQELRSYFPYQAVKDGILQLTAEMFGLRYVPSDVPVWHESVEAYDVMRGDEHVGRLYLDMHPREGKYKHAAVFPIQSGVEGRQLPEGALVCNFPGGDGTAGLMEHDQVETFLHELGHLLHHVLGGQQRWVEKSGFNVEWDFVEVPSQLLEEWAWDAESLRRFARNDKGELLPVEMVERMRRARDVGKGLWVRQQMFYAALALSYYERDPSSFEAARVMRELQARYSAFEYVDDTHFHLSFGHLFGYSAMYYTYMWSLVIAKDLFGVFEKKGMLDPNVARHYRQTILEPGGTRDADLMVEDFLGRQYSFDAFGRWLERD